MIYRAVANRVAMDFSSLKLKVRAGEDSKEITQDEAIERLTRLGCKRVYPDIVALARSLVGRAVYRRGAHPSEAPDVVDCSSMIKWLFGHLGVWLPRRTVQQRKEGEPVIGSDLLPGDVMYRTGFHNWYLDDPRDGVGHVGICLGDKRIIHAANGQRGIVEETREEFLGNKPNICRGTRRFFDSQTVIFETPADLAIETSDDIRWILLSRFADSV